LFYVNRETEEILQEPPHIDEIMDRV
jgi:hypothetical protein